MRGDLTKHYGNEKDMGINIGGDDERAGDGDTRSI